MKAVSSERGAIVTYVTFLEVEEEMEDMALINGTLFVQTHLRKYMLHPSHSPKRLGPWEGRQLRGLCDTCTEAVHLGDRLMEVRKSGAVTCTTGAGQSEQLQWVEGSIVDVSQYLSCGNKIWGVGTYSLKVR